MPPAIRFVSKLFLAIFFSFIAFPAWSANLTVTTNTTLSTGSYTYDDVTVSNNANLTLEGTVHITADNITVSSGSKITADKKGYAANSGPGAGAYVASGGSGAGHGGDGGRSGPLPAAGKYYGSATHPVTMGSGGGGTGCTINSVAVNSGGKGGGGIWLEVENTLTVSGTISANGGDGSEFLCDAQSGGGAGGSIYIVTDTFAGAGDIVAKGGKGGQTLLRGGGGGGGRIAVYYETSTFSGDVVATGGFGKTESGVSGTGFDGTVGFFDTDGNDFSAGHDWRFQFDDQPFNFDTITIDNGSQTTTEGTITITGTQLIVDGNSTLITSDLDELTFNDVSVTGSSSIEGNLLLQANNLTIASGSSVSADGMGFAGGMGVGAGLPNQGHGGGGGGGYGGEGGTNVGGIEYGSPTAPVDLGSGGAGPGFSSGGVAFASSGGYGGGKIQLNISGTLTVNGDLTANGNNAFAQGSQAGGGSGGSIYVITEKFTGSGSITANGGNSGPTGGSGAGGGGAGGRIAIFHRQSETFGGTPVATGGNGVGENGENGTVIVSQSQLAIYPTKGGDTGEVSVLISGSVFDDNSVIKLEKSGELDIVGKLESVENNGTLLRTIFDLTGKDLGAWDLVVENPILQSKTLTDAFTIEEGSKPNLWVEVLGPTRTRSGRQQRYLVAFGNRGNTDVASAHVYLQTNGGTGTQKFGEAGDSISLSNNTAYQALTFNMGPGRSHSIPYNVTSTSTYNIDTGVSHDAFEIVDFHGRIDDPEASITVLPTPQFKADANHEVIYPRYVRPGEFAPAGYVYMFMLDSGFYETALSLGSGDVLWSIPGEGSVVTTLSAALENDQVIGTFGAWRPKKDWGFDPATGELYDPDVLATIVTTATDHLLGQNFCTYSRDGVCYNKDKSPKNPPESGISCIDLVTEALQVILDEPTLFDKDYVTNISLLEEISAMNIPQPLSFLSFFNKLGLDIKIATLRRSIVIDSSNDPNEIIGPIGFEAARYISNEERLQYAIFFENLESATAAAQEIVITDQLDSSKMDLETFSLGPISFGETMVTPPNGVSEYITEVDLRPETDVIVRIEARLDKSSEIITWKFNSLDPETHMLTDDPLLGFLPPNDTPPEGDGFVSYSLKSTSELVTEDEIINSASIIFDANEPISTGEWVNTIDETKPESEMNGMDPTGTLTSFDISWSGSDAHSGVKEYTIYVSENSGPYVETLTTSGTFTSFEGVNGSTYSFYSRATDNVGNFEDAPSQPDVTITINDPMQEPCTINTNYIVGVTCFGTTTVTNDSQLENYLTDYDYNGTNYKKLHINYNITIENMDIHSPCDITIASNKTLTGERICIDGRNKVDSASGLTVNGTLVSFISELGDSTVGTNSTITANDLLIQGYKTAEIPSSAVVNVDGPILIKSTGNTSTSKARMGQDSVISAESVRLEAVRESSTGPGMQLTVADELEIISTGTDTSSKAETGISSEITAGSLEMSANKSVAIGNTSTVDISGEATMTSTGSSTTSDVTVKIESLFSADSLDITAGDDAVLQADSEITVTNNFHMQAATVNDCSISGTATITAGSESGNCL